MKNILNLIFAAFFGVFGLFFVLLWLLCCIVFILPIRLLWRSLFALCSLRTIYKIYKIEEELENKIANGVTGGESYAGCKKRILKEDYGIDWHEPRVEDFWWYPFVHLCPFSHISIRRASLPEKEDMLVLTTESSDS